jgi:hypothetical protein
MMPSLKPTNPLVFDSLNSRIWFAEGSRLNQINFEDQKPIVKKIAEAKHHLKSIHIVKDGIFAHTQHTILRYSLAGELVQTIPVEGKNKLLNMHLNQSQHSYLFASGLLEVYRIEDQSVHRFKLPFDQTEALEAMVTDGSYFVALVEGKPRAFQLESAP